MPKLVLNGGRIELTVGSTESDQALVLGFRPDYYRADESEYSLQIYDEDCGLREYPVSERQFRTVLRMLDVCK